MSVTVFANGMSIACKVGSGKTIAAMPDVCLSPPSPPAGPLPIPYPNTASASDTDKGSKTVQIGGDAVMLKDKSVFKTSTGNEAATKSLGMSVVTHQIQGEASFVAWSMDVKFEGENVPRHMDLMGHNEACSPTATPPWLFTERMAMANVKECDEVRQRVKDVCTPWEKKAVCPSTTILDAAKKHLKSFAKKTVGRKNAQTVLDDAHQQFAISIQENKCHNELRCVLVPFNMKCCPGQTAEHLIPASQFGSARGRGHASYKASKAPCVCAEGGKSAATHGLLGQARREYMEEHKIPIGKKPVWTMEASAKCGAASAKKTFRHCDQDCFEAQLKKGHNDLGVPDHELINSSQEQVLKDNSGFSAELSSSFGVK
jgi:hypothetical protein